MSQYKRSIADKLNTLLFGKDIRVTDGEPFSEVYRGDFSSYFPKEKYMKKQFPEKEPFFFVSDRLTDNTDYTEAVNKTITECSLSGGGTVIIKDGNFAVNTIFLKSNVTLFIDETATLTASHETDKFEKEAILFADNCENIEITGGGKICGEGNYFGLKPVKEPLFTPPEVIDVIEMRKSYRERIRFAHPSKYGSIANIVNCRNLSVHNIIFENSASWTLHLQMCNNVNVYDFMINNNRHVANADGIDINCTSDLKINHCFVSTADDGICIKNAVYTGCKGEMKNVSVTDCEVISATNSFKIGTETTNDIHNITVTDCKFFMTDIYPGSVSGISLESCDGSGVYDVLIKNIEMNRVACPLFIRLGNRNRAAQVDENTARATEMKVDESKKPQPADKNRFNFKSELYNITIENIKATDIEEPIIISGFKDRYGTKCVRNVTLRNFDLHYRNAKEVIDHRLFIPEYAHDYPESSRFRNLPSYRFFVRHTENLTYENISCESVKGSLRPADYFKDCR